MAFSKFETIAFVCLFDYWILDIICDLLFGAWNLLYF